MVRRVLILLVSIGALVGCGSVPLFSVSNKSAAGVPTEQPAKVTGTMAIFDAKTEQNDAIPDIFVGVSISGGGSRAANFGLAALQQLRHYGLLEQLTVISTTSGGGLPGAYYALNSSNLDWDKARLLMGTNFLARWAVKNVLPHHLITTSFTHKDRSDLMAEVFDEVLFHDATFARLSKFQPGTHPVWLANATTAVNGERAAFSREMFERLGSDIRTFPISKAAMASAAFPGVFNNITLASFVPLSGGALQEEPAAYFHFYDGGPADNLGLESLLYMAASHRNARLLQNIYRSSNYKGTACLLLVVDAYPETFDVDSLEDPDPRAWYDHLVDSNFMSAFDVLLGKRRMELLQATGLDGIDSYAEVDVPENIKPGSRLQPLTSIVKIYRGQVKPEGYSGGEVPVARDHFRCGVWHINLSKVNRLPRAQTPSEALETRIDMEKTSNETERLEKLSRLITQVKTSFRLTGPQGCSSDFLQEALYAAAHKLIAENLKARASACDVLVKAKVVNEARCNAPPVRRVADSMLWDVVGETSASSTGYLVGCNSKSASR